MTHKIANVTYQLDSKLPEAEKAVYYEWRQIQYNLQDRGTLCKTQRYLQETDSNEVK